MRVMPPLAPCASASPRGVSFWCCLSSSAACAPQPSHPPVHPVVCRVPGRARRSRSFVLQVTLAAELPHIVSRCRCAARVSTAWCPPIVRRTRLSSLPAACFYARCFTPALTGVNIHPSDPMEEPFTSLPLLLPRRSRVPLRCVRVRLQRHRHLRRATTGRLVRCARAWKFDH